MYERRFGDSAAIVNSSIAGVAGADFTDVGARLARDAIVLNGGLGVEFNDRFSISANYSGSFSRTGDSHRGSLTAKWRF